ncbi:hypothetical protein [Polycladospora coralii]|nr:hypothetical protein [Polycladospora coralii]
MRDFWIHLLIIPGVFILGRLSATVKVAGFRTKSPTSKQSF